MDVVVVGKGFLVEFTFVLRSQQKQPTISSAFQATGRKPFYWQDARCKFSRPQAASFRQQVAGKG
jgi:hypothetical protein